MTVAVDRDEGSPLRTLVTGAGGFVGRALVARLAARDEGAVVASDIAHEDAPPLPGVSYHTGSLTDPVKMGRLMAGGFDRIVHLATVAGVGSLQFDQGRAMNLVATQALLEAARSVDRPPRFVYASSVGVFGSPLPPRIDDDTLPIPTSSYGTHKLVCELLVGDYSRAGLIQGLALRLPGLVARPAGSGTMLSAFLSDVFHATRAGTPFDLPLAPDDGSWVMSLNCLVDNLVRALTLPADALPPRRYWTLPALTLRMDALVEQLTRTYGADRTAGIRFAPREDVRAMFAQVPLVAPGAERLGLTGDGTPAAFVRNVIAGAAALQPEEQTA